MIIFKTIAALQRYLNKLHNKNIRTGFVPTMGALHQGHISLIKESRTQCDVTICSIFINPTQFNDKNDFEKYPVTLENDIFLLETNHADILFLPSVKEIYPDGINKLQHFDIGYLENTQEGKYRPGHFQGVCNVVFRLLKIVNPNTLFLGRKDYQQYLILKNMMQPIFPAINIKAVDTTREPNGLAMSSRNMRLSDDARTKASALHKALQFIQQNIGTQTIDALAQQAKNIILANGFKKINYVEVCDASTLLPVTDDISNKKLIALAAAFIEDVRLIDNVII
jgi:pantoate--beta-alanine ligase